MDDTIDLAGAFASHERRVYTYFRRMVGEGDAARDLTQETFVRALRGATRFSGDAPVEAWLLGIARNVFLEWLRKAGRERVVEHVDPPGAVAGSEEERLDVERTLASLDPEHREVLVLRFSLDLRRGRRPPPRHQPRRRAAARGEGQGGVPGGVGGLMTDPEELIASLPDASPPPEIVLAAVRVFRYRVLAVVALAVALAVVGVVLVQKLAANGRFLAEAGAAHYTGMVLKDAPGVGEFEAADGITLTVWEVVTSPDGRTVYVHVIGWDERGRSLILDTRDPRFGGVPASEVGLEGNPGGTEDRTLLDLWFAVERVTPGPLTFDAIVLRVARHGDDEVVASVPFEIAMEQGMP